MSLKKLTNEEYKFDISEGDVMSAFLGEKHHYEQHKQTHELSECYSCTRE